MDHKEKDDFDVDIQACSTMDCTGLIPSLPQDEAEKEAYEDLYPYVTTAVSSDKEYWQGSPSEKNGAETLSLCSVLFYASFYTSFYALSYALSYCPGCAVRMDSLLAGRGQPPSPMHKSA